jgi:hypothetical protein
MWYIELLYLLLIIFIIILIFLIFTYSSYQTKNIFVGTNTDGLSVSATTTLTNITSGSAILSLVPVTSSRSQNVEGKFIIQLSASATIDIYLHVTDQGKVIGEKTKYTIWEKDSYGITQISLSFNSDILSSGTAHNIIPQIATVTGSSSVNLHSVYVYYF